MYCGTYLILLASAVSLCSAVFKDGECEVCIKFLSKFDASLADRSKKEVVDKSFRQTCKESRTRDHRFCYYVGGLEDSATGLLSEITKPMMNHVPVEKICEKLKKMDSQICDLVYDKEIDWKTIDLNKLRVKGLKKILEDWGEDCKGCLEKPDFIQRINDLKPKYVKSEL